ncbi:MAG: 50S ribosomal protein L25 [Elusimicrobia bacterium]|nr:50S ribosomal protein L25 [Elusimicrobiota bacterium]
MDKIEITAELRDGNATRGALNDLRKKGKVPAVIYGGKKPPVSLAVPEKEISGIIKKNINAIIKINYADQQDNVIIKEAQKHVVDCNFIHIDFKRIALTEKIKVKVPVKLIGEAYGIKVQAGIIEHNLRELNVMCLPAKIPKELEINISELHIGSSLRVKDAPTGDYELVDDPEHIIVSVVAPKEEVVEAAPATVEPGAETQEPEVIAKGKKEEEGEEPAADAKSAAGKPAGGPATVGKEQPKAKEPHPKPEEKKK